MTEPTKPTYNNGAMPNPGPRVEGGIAAEDPVAAGAIRRYEERLARDPTSLAFAPLADAYRKAGRTQEAIRLCREGLARLPHYATARLILAKAYLEEGNTRDAVFELETVLKSSPRDAQAHRLAGEIHRKAGRLEQAASHLEQVAKLDPGDRESRVMLEALRGHGQILESSPFARVMADDTFATPTFGMLCLEHGLVDEAVQIFLRFAKRNPGHARAWEWLNEALEAKTQRRRGTERDAGVDR